MVISQLTIYPIKSLGGFSVSTAKVLSKGLEFDRRWMLVDENHRFLTQRALPHMALFSTEVVLHEQKLIIRFESDTVQAPLVAKGSAMRATVWGDEVDVITMDAAIDHWFSQLLGFTCRLVAFPEENSRPVDSDYAISDSNQTSLSDGYPILMVGEASLYDLNARLTEPVTMDRFRPNIVFSGGLPYAEDNWKRFSIGGVKMAGVKPCGRCTVTTVNQQTATVGKEPLATLSTYRKVDNKVLFGQNVIPITEGVIAVGDKLVVGDDVF